MVTLHLFLLLPLSAPSFPLLLFLGFQSRQQFSHVVVLLLGEDQGSFCHLQPAQRRITGRELLLEKLQRSQLPRPLVSKLTFPHSDVAENRVDTLNQLTVSSVFSY